MALLQVSGRQGCFYPQMLSGLCSMHGLDKDKTVSQEAAYWYVRVADEKGIPRSDRRMFLNWLKAADRHIREFLRICSLDAAFRSPDLRRCATAAVATAALLSNLTPSPDRTDQSFAAGKAVVELARTDQGQVISADRAQFVRIARALKRDPDVVHQIHWRQWEELVAAAYDLEGFEVILTPRTNDRGRDIIATRTGAVPVRVYDQVKAFSAGRLVSAHDVFTLVGVLSSEPNVSKAIITATTDFAPGVYRDSRLQQYIPYRLELRPRPSLLSWMSQLG